MSFKTYLVASLKIAFKTSKIDVIQKKIVTKFHVWNDLEEINYKKVKSKVFTKFHRSRYEEKSQNSLIDQGKIDKESDSELESKTKEQSVEILTINKINNLEKEISYKTVIPQNAQLVKIIVMGGQIREKVYLETEGSEISIQYA